MSCSALVNVKVEWMTPIEVESTVFNQCPLSRASLQVPNGTKDKYAAAEGWKKFNKIVEYETSGIATIPADDTVPQQIYDLSGRKHSEKHKGLNIINGKKTFYF